MPPKRVGVATCANDERGAEKIVEQIIKDIKNNFNLCIVKNINNRYDTISMGLMQYTKTLNYVFIITIIVKVIMLIIIEPFFSYL